MIRPPIDLPMHHDLAGVTCLVGQLLYVFGDDDHAPDLQEIERKAGCQENDTLTMLDAYRVLMANGFIIYECGPYRHDLFMQHGVAYLQNNVYADVDWDSLAEFYTPEYLGELRYRTGLLLSAIKENPGSYHRIPQPPTIQQAYEAISNGYAISAFVPSPDDAASLTELLLTPSASLAPMLGWTYSPASRSGTVTPLHLRAVWSQVVLREGVALIRHRGQIARG